MSFGEFRVKSNCFTRCRLSSFRVLVAVSSDVYRGVIIGFSKGCPSFANDGLRATTNSYLSIARANVGGIPLSVMAEFGSCCNKSVPSCQPLAPLDEVLGLSPLKLARCRLLATRSPTSLRRQMSPRNAELLRRSTRSRRERHTVGSRQRWMWALAEQRNVQIGVPVRESEPLVRKDTLQLQ
jgi:hypothetical protein